MTEDEKEFVKKINVDKAKNKTMIPILLSVISLLTYVVPLIEGEFDFGIIFETIALIFILMARKCMLEYDELRSKKYVIFAMIPIGWLLLYDLFFILLSATDIVDLILGGYDLFYGEIFSILNIAMLLVIHKDLSKADNPEKYKESTDWFYEKLDAKQNGGNKNA